nr:EOG090X0IC1 [Eubosmina coregoni]
MSLNVQLNKSVLNNNEIKLNNKCIVHSLPCKIVHNGAANVSGFFTPYIEDDNDLSKEGVKKTSFRGYPLEGKKIVVTDSFTGLTVISKMPLTDMEKKCVLVNNTFKEFTYWNWDYIPTETDPMQQAIDWLSLAEVIHE